jgi:phage virion morphogenesis protein
MAKLEISSLKDILADLKNPLESQNYEKMKRSIMAQIIRQKDMVFQREVSPDGNQWAKLSQMAEERRNEKRSKNPVKNENGEVKYAFHKVLQDTGTLRNSVSAPVAPHGIRSTIGDEVQVGTNLNYAATHQYGADIRPTKAKALAIPMAGGGVVFAKHVRIPSRPFLGFSSDGKDEQEIQKIIQRHVTNYLVK